MTVSVRKVQWLSVSVRKVQWLSVSVRKVQWLSVSVRKVQWLSVSVRKVQWLSGNVRKVQAKIWFYLMYVCLLFCSYIYIYIYVCVCVCVCVCLFVCFKKWNSATLIPVYKKGNREHPNNDKRFKFVLQNLRDNIKLKILKNYSETCLD
jgi:hypothetical protein